MSVSVVIPCYKTYNAQGLSKIPWSYAVYDDGTPISKETRYAFRETEEHKRATNPFAASEAAILALQKQSHSRRFAELARKVPASLRQNGLKATIKKIKNAFFG